MSKTENNLAIPLEDGEVVATGLSNIEGGYRSYSLVYEESRTDSHSAVPPKDVEKLTLLGFHLSSHWVPSTHKQGYRASKQLRWVEGTEFVSKKVIAFFSEDQTNHLYKYQLDEEY